MREDLINIAKDCVPFIDKMKATRCVITIPAAGEEDDETTVNFLFKKTDDDHWTVEYKRFDAVGKELGDWQELGTFERIPTFQFLKT